MIDFSSMIFDTLMNPLEKKGLSQRRRHLISKASGKVLEIGPGTGANCAFYNFHNITDLTLLDLSFSKKLVHYPFPKNASVNFFEGSAESLPFPSNSFDSVIFTLVFCSVPDPLKGFEEVYRVLKPGGKIYFMEHVLSDQSFYSDIMDKSNKFWRKIASGCNLNRNTLYFIEQANFKIIEYERFWKGAFIKGIGIK
ncbi:class I SAM-dependent methyltransferase [Anaeromicrobium sediminis]|uniref:Methyltransferase type 11 domain-containing protein n=1 Tax=Anaeromicrobium sediminis TaxID=1478221 RepID=A0A267MKW7_9FIRM|nr:class I SAM-dependent methyltransferase [Anaeromicrobium sediminis]PAB60231.1 hypothetical protein CCE28_04855 [Anaeromicrobium sediminis]